MKKSQMLKFLFWTIVAIVFLLPACTLGSNLLKFSSDNSEKSYSALIDVIENTATQPVASIAVSMNKKSVIVGFSRGRKFENYRIGEGRPKSIFNRPAGCGSKACICLCKGYKLERFGVDNIETCDEIICNTLDGINLFSGKEVPVDDPKYRWLGGFLIHRDISDSEDVNGLEHNNIPTRTFYVQRVGDVVGVCLERPTIEKPCVT